MTRGRHGVYNEAMNATNRAYAPTTKGAHMPKDYVLVARYLVKGEGWKEDREDLLDFSFVGAGEIASDRAHRLDATYGNDHFWTVDLVNAQGESYFQLFHGRLS